MTYTSQHALYSQAFQTHANEFDLFDSIPAERKSGDKYFDHITVRKLNGDLFPYHRETFIGWFERSFQDPNSRENLRYLQRRIEFKKEMIAKFGHLTVEEVNDKFVDNILFEAVKNYESHDFSYARAFVDLACLQRNGWICNLDYPQAVKYLNDKPVGSWVIRKSSAKNKIKNIERAAIALKIEHKIHQQRILHIQGVGWFHTNVGDFLSEADLRSKINLSQYATNLWDLLRAFLHIPSISIPQQIVVEVSGVGGHLSLENFQKQVSLRTSFPYDQCVIKSNGVYDITYNNEQEAMIVAEILNGIRVAGSKWISHCHSPIIIEEVKDFAESEDSSNYEGSFLYLIHNLPQLYHYLERRQCPQFLINSLNNQMVAWNTLMIKTHFHLLIIDNQKIQLIVKYL